MNDPRDRTLRDLVADARSLAASLERLETTNADRSLNLRLATAHTLALVDRLEEALRESEARPNVRSDGGPALGMTAHS